MLETAALSLRAGHRVLVDALRLRIEPGQCWCLIGRNGAGKSTLLRTLAGLAMPASGQVRLAGRPLDDWPLLALARQRAWLPQRRSDAFGYRAIDTVLAACHPYQEAHYWESEADIEHARDALRMLDVAHLEERDVRTLSGGERQRVAIAAVLAQRTPLLLLDEPTAALDLAHQVATLKLLARLCREQRRTVVMATHELNLAADSASHALLLMGDGGWRAGPLHEVLGEDSLSQCLGYPVERIEHEGRTLYLPARESR